MDLGDRIGSASEIHQSYEDSRLHKMATLMATDYDFAVFRKFSELRFYNLLHIQHHLIELERKLRKNLGERRDVSEITIKIRQELKEYGE
jgi:hypothetical protein